MCTEISNQRVSENKCGGLKNCISAETCWRSIYVQCALNRDVISMNVKYPGSLLDRAMVFGSVLAQIIQGVSRLVEIIAGGDFLGICDQKRSYEHLSDFGRLRSYGHF
jgi:hypothetical protein